MLSSWVSEGSLGSFVGSVAGGREERDASTRSRGLTSFWLLGSLQVGRRVRGLALRGLRSLSYGTDELLCMFSFHLSGDGWSRQSTQSPPIHRAPELLPHHLLKPNLRPLPHRLSLRCLNSRSSSPNPSRESQPDRKQASLLRFDDDLGESRSEGDVSLGEVVGGVG